MSLMNRLGNTNNEYQTSAKRVLCVCSAGMLRSPTLANVLHEKFGFNTRACGYVKEFALVVLDQVLVKWADEVVFVEEDVKRGAFQLYGEWFNKYEQELITLNLPDVYNWNSPELRAACLEQYLAAIS